MIGRQWGEVLEPQGVAVQLLHPGAVATDMNTGAGTITPAVSAKAVFSVLSKMVISDCSKGILSYDGTIYPW